MGKRDAHLQALESLLDQFVKTGSEQELVDYLLSNSNLPGPRANLELADAFPDALGKIAQKESHKCWALCMKMLELTVEEAPVNTPEEFVPFCGAVGIGSMGSVQPSFFDQAIVTLRRLAKDSRWRMREAVRMGLQRLAEARARDTLMALESWIDEGDWLEMRAIAATVAMPSLLENEEQAAWALSLHRKIFDRVLETQDRKSEQFRVMRKALGYTLSVVVSALPREGFEFMTQLIEPQDKDVKWILRENLKKKRLEMNFPGEVAEIKNLLVL
ncbi:MAG TPA: hypothetical protein G4O14_06380 [Anaerolineae bacterium]|nr:hypothetical protein [Anaerolineae bacterium]